MVPSRNGPKGADVASFGLATLVFLLTPTQAGYQDLAALLAQQPSVAARWRDHLIASPFGTIHAATFSMPRPIGTAIPESPLVRLASLSTASTSPARPATDRSRSRRAPQVVFPEINRSGKGDRLVPSAPAQPEPASLDEQASPPAGTPAPSFSSGRPKAAEIDHTDSELPDAQTVVLAEIGREAHRRNAPAAAPDEIAAAMHFEPFPEYDVSLSLELDPKIVEEAADLADLDPTEFTPNAPPSLEGLNAEMKDTRLYFGIDPFGTCARRHQAVGDRRGAAHAPPIPT